MPLRSNYLKRCALCDHGGRSEWSGKTTTIGKLAYKFKEAGKKVVLGAADTFRAAAVDQLVIWADRVGVPIVKQAMGADPASVAYDTLSKAKRRS